MFLGKVSRSFYCVDLLWLDADCFTISVRLPSSTLEMFTTLLNSRLKCVSSLLTILITMRRDC